MSIRLAIIGILVLALGACAGKPRAFFDYQISQSVLTEGPPRATGEGIAPADTVSSFPDIKIDPSKVVGYDRLSDDMRNLYGPEPLEIGLEDIVFQTLANNRDIKIQGYSLQIADHQVPIAKSIYDLLIQASARYGKNKVQTFSPLAPGLRRDRNYRAGVRQLLPTGATLDVAYTLDRINQVFVFSSINPTYTHAIAATLRQPLLRGFGPKRTNADIHIAQLNSQASAADFQAQVEVQLAASLNLLWDLVAAVHSYDVQVISYTAALDLHRINKAKAEAGVMANTQVLQAKASVEQRREFVIRTRQVVRNLEDRLKRRVFFQEGSPDWSLELRPTQDLVWREQQVQGDQLLGAAYQQRAEVRAASKRVSGAEINVAKTKHDRLPQLDLIGEAGIAGVGQASGAARNSLRTADFNSLAIGAEFSYPLQNRQRRYAYKQAVSQRNQAAEQLEKIKDRVAFEVRTSVRDLDTSRERIDITHSRVESEQANLDAERKRYDVGVSTSFEVLEFQEDLAAAQEAHIFAIVDYNKAQIAIERARGTLLETYGIVFNSPELEPEDDRVLFPVGLN